MFKPSNNKKGDSSPLLRPDADAVSLHSTHADSGFGGSSSSSRNRHAAFLDADDDAPELFLDSDDLPPLYSDVVGEDDEAADGEHQPQSQGQNANGNGGRSSGAPGVGRFRYPTTIVGEPQKWRYDMMPNWGGGSNTVDENTRRLVDMVEAWAQIPPRPYVQLRGTHCETVNKDGKKETREVVDFDVKVELTPYLYSDVRSYESWRTVRLPGNHDKVRRGTVFKCKEPTASGPPRLGDEEQQVPALAAGDNGNDNGSDNDNDNDNGDGEAGPTLEDWCRRYCADPAKLRAFQLKRRMTGFDYERVRSMMNALVRRTNYQGGLQVLFPVDEVGHVFYSQHRFNRWRLSRWIQALCVLTLTILFTWPYLFFATKRYEVISVDWPFSRTYRDGHKYYISLKEDQWYNMWARAITNGVLSKRQGTLDQEDLRQSEGAPPTLQSTGNTTVDGALGFVRAGINAMNQVNRQRGWGGNC
ncbi:hypothetical protein SCUCBS95973_004415 [Sporothrix curviconia]|uniref:Abc transporter n=1 Tax=Sporothrix curviconia TaxID=1260050 RepID=A0ABP0BP37_9PEZI